MDTYGVDFKYLTDLNAEVFYHINYALPDSSLVGLELL